MILQAALRIIDRDGVDGLSMRRLSDAVGRDPVMLYRHLPNKAALLDGVAEIVLAQLAVDTADPDWAGQLRIVAHDFRRLALAHPNVVPLLVTRPLATPLGQRPPGMLRPLEDVLTLLSSAGFTGDDALHIYRVLFAYLNGHILNELQEIIERPEETDHVLRLGSAPAHDHPPITCSGTSPGLLRRRHRTRPRPRSPAPRANRNPHPTRRITPNHLSPTRTASPTNGGERAPISVLPGAMARTCGQSNASHSTSDLYQFPIVGGASERTDRFVTPS
jgi:AcrR family transcriptional regulator